MGSRLQEPARVVTVALRSATWGGVLLSACFAPTTPLVPNATGTETETSSTGTTATSGVSTSSTSSSTSNGSASSSASDVSSASNGATSTPDTTTGQTSQGGSSSGVLACDADDICVPLFPSEQGWIGPVILNSSGGPCPPNYNIGQPAAHRDLIEGTYGCSCDCSHEGTTCDLILNQSGQVFEPVGVCDDPPFDNECLRVEANSTCTDNGVDNPATPVWNETYDVCAAGTDRGPCDQGHCFADPGQQVCIRRPGDHPCPPAFSDRALYHEQFQDDRSCSACSCSASGESCSMDLEICDLGFTDVTLSSTDAGCYQLNTSDGDDVTLLAENITSASCTPDAGAGVLSGMAQPTFPVTVCCLP